MANTLVRTFDKFSDAENARNALLRSGFSPESVHLVSQQDEAGPVEGNFILEYKDADHDRDVSFLDALTGRDDPNEGKGRSEVAWRGTYLLTVDASDNEQFNRASRITEEFGTSAPDDRPAS
ncbi:MAG: hypothetical protein JWQ23_371 [Herminiimonas sp.]|nr:hypothetical protein [Herminiimonas sp.]